MIILLMILVATIQILNGPGQHHVPIEVEEVDVMEKEDVDPDELEEEESLPHESLLEGLSKNSEFKSGEAIGQLKIPKVNLVMSVIENASAANLNTSLARMISSDLPGQEGNFVITGHRMYQYGSHFNRLDEIEVGDEIFFEDKNHHYRYVVESITFVEASEIWITMGTNRESLLTLITCTPIARATHRLIIFASLQEVLPLAHESASLL